MPGPKERFENSWANKPFAEKRGANMKKKTVSTVVLMVLLMTLAVAAFGGCAKNAPQPSTGPSSDSSPGAASPNPPAAIEGTDNPNDLSAPMANLPRSDAVDLIWHRLSGYWTAGGDLFVGFSSDGVPRFTYGIYETEFSRKDGELIQSEAIGGNEGVFTFRYLEAPAADIRVWIDVSGLDNDGKINIKIEDVGSGEYTTFAHNGSTAEEAYRNR